MAAIHADDLLTVVASKNTLCLQANMITDFTNMNHLKLNSSKLEILRVAKQHKDPERIDIAGS